MNKKSVLIRLLQQDSLKTKTDYIKQYKMLGALMKKMPNEDFWSAVTFPEKLKTLYFLKTKYGKGLLTKKYKSFNRRIPPPKRYNLKEKVGEDATYKPRQKTVRDFLK